MCNCKNVDVGSFDNQIEIDHPSLLHPIMVDTCIAEEVIMLLHKGVKTVASCCGHNKTIPSIMVAPESVKRMEALGYRHVFNRCLVTGPYSKNTFYSETVKCSWRIKLTKVWLPYLMYKFFN